jgi:hypothetical protein
LSRFCYAALCRADKGVVLRYLERTTTGYSRQQLTRLVARCRGGVPLAKRYKPPVAGFTCKFSAADVALLARTDALHGTLSGPATVHLLQRACQIYGDERYRRLASLSGAPDAPRALAFRGGTSSTCLWVHLLTS